MPNQFLNDVINIQKGILGHTLQQGYICYH